MKYFYKSKNIGGNLHYVREWLNEREPHADVVAVHGGGTSSVVLYREPYDEQKAIDGQRKRDAEAKRLSDQFAMLGGKCTCGIEGEDPRAHMFECEFRRLCKV